MPAEPAIVYTVTATLPNADLMDSYVDWLTGGHVQAVLAAGASEARVLKLLDNEGPLRVKSQYYFPSRSAFDTYVRDHAPALRAEGLALFGPETGTRMDREIARVLWPG